MANSAMLRSTAKVLRRLESGILGYISSDKGCYLLLSNHEAAKITVAGTDIAPRFECFSLAIESAHLPEEPVIDFAPVKGCTVTSVLLREEYIKPFSGDPATLVGTPPATTQSAAKPGQVPDAAIASCLVAYGLLIEGDKHRLLIAADWQPYRIEATTESRRIDALLAESEAVSVARYILRYGVQ